MKSKDTDGSNSFDSFDIMNQDAQLLCFKVKDCIYKVLVNYVNPIGQQCYRRLNSIHTPPKSGTKRSQSSRSCVMHHISVFSATIQNFVFNIDYRATIKAMTAPRIPPAGAKTPGAAPSGALVSLVSPSLVVGV